MRRGEEKELEAGKGRRLFRDDTFLSRNGNVPKIEGAAAHCAPALRALVVAAVTFLAFTSACGGSAPAASSPPPAPPPTSGGVTVIVAPGSASVVLGNSVSFSATVTGTNDTAVSWAVNGVPGGAPSLGTISASGTYQAPAVMPSPSSVQVQATSEANTATVGSASVTVTSDVRVQAAPPSASVAAGGTQQFTATIASTGHPATAVMWSLAGAGCTGSACGSVSTAGLYTAPATPPQPPQVTLTATSVADGTKSATATITVTTSSTPPPAVAIAPANATVALEQSLNFTATFTGTAAQAVTWSVNGIPGGSTAVGTISNSATQNGMYLAPVNMPSGRAVTISALSTGTPALTSSVTLQLTSNIAVNISPLSAVRVVGARQTFTAMVAHTSNSQIGWTVNGVPNGNATFGWICISGSNPCQAPPQAAPPGTVDYLAPASPPIPAQVTVEAVSVADPSRWAAASVTISAQVSVAVAPPTLTIAPGQTQTFTAMVLGTPDAGVTWDVDGSINGSIRGGLLCLPASNPCQAPDGPYTGGVEYRAPAAPPSPNVVALRATTAAAPMAQAIVPVTISTSPFITGVVPASVFAGAANTFNLTVTGVQFTASTPGPGTIVLINGVPRATTCLSSAECDTTINPADVSAAGTVAVSVETGGALHAPGNTVDLMVVAPTSHIASVALNTATPNASGMDIIVVEPTLAGGAAPEQLTLLELGLVDPISGECQLVAPPLTLTRPAGGSTTFRVCAFGTALDQVTQAGFSSASPPGSSDISVSNLNASLGSISIEFDAVLPAGAAAGPRTLFVTTANLDAAALTAAVLAQ